MRVQFWPGPIVATQKSWLRSKVVTTEQWPVTTAGVARALSSNNAGNFILDDGMTDFLVL